MKESAQYIKLVEWSQEDNCYIGRCPELLEGGCHGDNEETVFHELCEIVEESIKLYKQDKKPLPSPKFQFESLCATWTTSHAS